MHRACFMLLLSMFCPVALHAQSPPPLSFDLPPAQSLTPQPPVQTHLMPAPLQQAPVMPAQSITYPTNTGPVKAGDTVRVLRRSIVRSGPSDQSYPCNTIEAGHQVVVAELPGYGSEYTAISAPEDCYSLIPESAIYILIRPKTLLTAPQPVRHITETYIDGEPGPSAEYLASRYKIPKGSLVSIVREKQIRVNGKLSNYCVIRNGGKEVRYVRTADLEGVESAARQAQSQPAYNQGPLYGSNNNWPGSNNSTLESDYLSPQLAGQVQAADQSYQAALRNGVWEDARLRYQYLLESDVLSIRILAKNRLEYIREWQQNPPVQTAARSPQQNSYASQPMNTDPWVPGGEGAARLPRYSPPVASAPVKDVTIRPAPQSNLPSSPLTSIPTYNDQPPVQNYPAAPRAAAPPATQPVQQLYVQPAPQQRPLPATPPGSQQVRVQGRLNRAVQYSPTPLFYLTDSQGMLSYFVRGTGNVSSQLNGLVGQNVLVEGLAINALIEGRLQKQINAAAARPLQ